jgi:hypothetical protein
LRLVKKMIQMIASACGYRIERMAPRDAYPVIRPMDRSHLEILADREFQQSCRSVNGVTLLDTPRLANLWSLCRLTDPNGAMAEIGAYKGGGALHLSNCCPGREVIVCDSFSATCFEHLDPKLDQLFRKGAFADTSHQAVAQLLNGRKATIIPGYFPESVSSVLLPRISFVHLDVDAYKATRESLHFILCMQQLCDKSLIVVDDYGREAEGVTRAVQEIVDEVSGTLAFPIFPGQGLIIPKTWSR